MNSHPQVSVIIPAYNAEAVLPVALQSLRDQSCHDWEALVVNDGSTDATLPVAQDAARTDSRIKVFSQAQSGVSVARNLALSHARGEWVAFLDADDVWLAEKLQAQMRLVAGAPAANLLFSNYFSWDGEKDLGAHYRQRSKFPETRLAHRLIFANLFCMSSVVVRRKTIEKVGAFDPSVTPAEDWDLWLRILDVGLCARGVREPLVRYRLWSGNASGNTLRMAQANLRVLEKNLAQTQRDDLRRLYRRSCRIARGNLELAQVRPTLEPQSEALPAALLRAWLHCPSRLKWLIRYFMVRWPGPLGGRALAASVHRKIAAKW